MSQSSTIASTWARCWRALSTAASIPSRRTSLDADDEVAGGERVAVHLGGVGEAREADLRDVLARQAVLHQGPHRIAVAQAVVELAHVEMRVERDQADLRERHPSASTAGRVIALLPPASSVSAWSSMLAATASRIGSVAWSIVSVPSLTSPRSRIGVNSDRGRCRCRIVRSASASPGEARAPGRSRPE